MNEIARKLDFSLRRLVSALIIIYFFAAPFASTYASGAVTEVFQEGKKAATRKLTGKIIDKNTKETLIGASVWLKDTSIGGTTDMDGNFNINVPGGKTVTLVISYLGYANIEKEISPSANNLLIEMSTDDTVLEEVQVVGYGTQRKESVIGSISTLSVSNLKVPSASISTNLAGQLGGVVSIQRDGSPGSSAEFWIRGISTFGANKTPLILVDGVERSLDLLDPEEIESFSLLKDGKEVFTMAEQIEKRKRILSGIQPTGTPTLGNYIGAVRNWALLQSDYDCLYMVADLHALTVRQTPANLRRQTREMAALLLAVGIDPEQHVLFVQSHVPAHCELSWVLACNTQFGELSRMTQFKDKSAKHPDNVNGGLFTYPVLMAADILIYNADLVPVGQDQTQHLEIARTIANRFNGIYGDTFTLPAGYVPKAGAKIMSLAEPTKKMSKSDTNANAFVLMTDDKDTIVRKFKRAVTDSDGVVRFDVENKPGVSNLMTIYSTFTGKDLAAIEAEFAGKGYGDFKLAVAEVTADALAPVQAEYGRILADKAYVDSVLKSGAERAARLANRTVSKVYRKVGLMQLDK